MWPYLLAGFASGGAGAVYPDVLMPPTGNLFCTSPVSVSIAARVLTTGILQGSNCGTYTNRGDWVSNKGPLFVSSDFEVQLTVDSGPDPTSGFPLAPAWHTIGGSISWIWSATPGEFNSGQWTMTIRQITDTGNTDSTVWTWATEDAS